MTDWLGVAATRAAWSSKVETSSQRLMLLAIARYADDSGKAFPSVDSICGDTCLSRNTAFKVLKELKELGLVSVEKRPNNANLYTVPVVCSDEGSTKTGSTNIATTKTGTTKIGTSSSPNIGTSVVANLGREEEQEEIIEENIFSTAPSFDDAVPEPPEDFFLDSFPADLLEDEGNKKKPAEKKAAKKKAITHKFNLEVLPEEWRTVCKEMRPDLDPDRVFAHFRFYWTAGKGANTFRSDKSWATSWTNWVLKEKENAYSSQSSPIADSSVGNFATDLSNLRCVPTARATSCKRTDDLDAALLFGGYR